MELYENIKRVQDSDIANINMNNKKMFKIFVSKESKKNMKGKAGGIKNWNKRTRVGEEQKLGKNVIVLSAVCLIFKVILCQEENRYPAMNIVLAL